MTDRAAIARAAAAGLRKFASQRSATPALVGFDGFVDSIIAVVDTRKDANNYEPVPTIARLGQKISAAAGMSSNYELVVKLQKLGGNGPIMANALASAGLPVTYLGNLGYPKLHPVFDDFAKIAKVITIAEPGYTDALEFDDGKLMLGKHQSLGDVNWKRLLEVVGEAKLIDLFSQSRFLGIVNWTMLTHLSDVFEKITTHVLPKLPATGGARRRRIFVDLADPEKRTREDLGKALKLIAGFEKYCDATLGLNLKEAVQVAEVLGVNPTDNPEANLEPLAVQLREKLGTNTVVIHPRRGAAAATVTNGTVVSARFAGPFVAVPKLSTGAGDNFNAGFSVAQLAQLPVEQALCVGTATSGYYVRNAGSPSLEQLAEFCDNLPAPE